MQITVKATKVGKTGTNKAGPWELIVVTSIDGTDYTTFHTGAKNLTAGSVIDIGEPKIEGGKCSFKEYKVISTAPASSGNGKPGMTPEQWAEKDRLEQWNRECNTCFMGIMDLAKNPPEDDKFKEIYGLALDYAKRHFIGADVAPEKKKAAPVAAKPKEAKEALEKVPAVFSTPGEFLTVVNTNLNLNKTQVLEMLSLSKIADIINFEEAYTTLEKNVAGG